MVDLAENSHFSRKPSGFKAKIKDTNIYPTTTKDNFLKI